jgi:hypothetical protein
MTRSRSYRQLPRAIRTSPSPHARLAAPSAKFSVAVTTTGGGSAITFQTMVPFPASLIWVTIVVILVIVILGLGRGLIPRGTLVLAKSRYSMRVTQRIRVPGPVY